MARSKVARDEGMRPFLPGIAQRQRVGVDAVAQQLHGHLIGIKHAHMLRAAHRLCQRRAALRSR